MVLVNNMLIAALGALAAFSIYVAKVDMSPSSMNGGGPVPHLTGDVL